MINSSTLGMVAAIQMGQSPPGHTYNEDGCGLPFFQGVRDFNYRFPTSRVYCTAPSRIADRGDILLSIRAPIGRVNVASERCATGRGIAIIRPRDVVDARYIEFVLRHSQSYWDSLEGGGAVFGNAKRSDLESVRLPWPEKPCRRKIAAILSVYEDLIENNLQRINILGEMAQGLYREWFVKFRYPGYQHAGFNDSPLGRIPEGWEATTIGNVASYISRGITPTYDDGSSSLVINQKCIRDHKLDLSLVRRHSGRIAPDKYVHFGDVLINSTGVGTLGRVAQVYAALSNTTVDTHVSIVRPQNIEDIDYLGLTLMDMESHFESLGAGATGQTELRRDRISETEVLLPLLDLRKRFSSMVSPVRTLGISLLEKNTTLRRTRDLLLPRLISGEVDVSELDIAVPEEAIA